MSPRLLSPGQGRAGKGRIRHHLLQHLKQVWIFHSSSEKAGWGSPRPPRPYLLGRDLFRRFQKKPWIGACIPGFSAKLMCPLVPWAVSLHLGLHKASSTHGCPGPTHTNQTPPWSVGQACACWKACHVTVMGSRGRNPWSGVIVVLPVTLKNILDTTPQVPQPCRPSAPSSPCSTPIPATLASAMLIGSPSLFPCQGLRIC